MKVRASIETGSRRVFATAIDWPGWARSGKDEARALEALRAYAPRYAAVAKAARIPFPPPAALELEVAERAAGSASTDFGVPAAVMPSDRRPLTPAEMDRLVVLVSASWRVLDRAVAKAPARLRKGPRGGGRDRDAIARHVREAEVAYAGKLGVRLAWSPEPGPAALKASRSALLGALRERASHTPLPAKGWPARYAARRIAWHVLDHAWEIEDRSAPAPAVAQSAASGPR